jgi:two-component system response regulator
MSCGISALRNSVICYFTVVTALLYTDASESGISECYDKSANCFIAKPLDFEKSLNVVQAIESFWFKIAQLPKTTL